MDVMETEVMYLYIGALVFCIIVFTVLLLSGGEVYRGGGEPTRCAVLRVLWG